MCLYSWCLLLSSVLSFLSMMDQKGGLDTYYLMFKCLLLGWNIYPSNDYLYKRWVYTFTLLASLCGQTNPMQYACFSHRYPVRSLAKHLMMSCPFPTLNHLFITKLWFDPVPNTSIRLEVSQGKWLLSVKWNHNLVWSYEALYLLQEFVMPYYWFIHIFKNNLKKWSAENDTDLK